MGSCPDTDIDPVYFLGSEGGTYLKLMNNF